MQNQDKVTVVQNMVITAETGKLITTSVRNEYSTVNSRAKAYDAAYADGVRAEMIVKDDPVRDQVKALMLAGMPAAERNLLDSKKEDYTQSEWDVKKVLKSNAAKDLGGLVSKFKKAMERREALEPEAIAAKAKADADAKAKAAAAAEVEPAVNLTPYQAMAKEVGKFVENIQEAENSPNVVEICAAGTAFVEALIEPKAEVEPEPEAS
tara:strand:- start:54 stop:680 length:627 start_codon:yes stop_codon:yes gene_type:complete